MGTSQSSSGPGSGVPLVPPWISDPDDETPTEVAPARRFGGARLNLGKFASSGSINSLKRGLGHYINRGLGGSRRATQRMSSTAFKAGTLYGVLNTLSVGAPPSVDLGIDIADLAKLPAPEIADRIVQIICPNDGTQDAEASRESMAFALSELISMEPSIDLTKLTEEQINHVIVLFIARDICSRIELDVGTHMDSKTHNVTMTLLRLNEMFSYVLQSVAASFRQLRVNQQALTQASATQLASNIIKNTFDVFESYLS